MNAESEVMRRGNIWCKVWQNGIDSDEACVMRGEVRSNLESVLGSGDAINVVDIKRYLS